MRGVNNLRKKLVTRHVAANSRRHIAEREKASERKGFLTPFPLTPFPLEGKRSHLDRLIGEDHTKARFAGVHWAQGCPSRDIADSQEQESAPARENAIGRIPRASLEGQGDQVAEPTGRQGVLIGKETVVEI